jgi:invasion protein IalB
VTPTPTEAYWHPRGAWKCVCTTPTHRRGQRLTQPQCSYCIFVNEPDTVETHTVEVRRQGQP